MCHNQTGRRNLTSVQRDYLIQQEYEAQKKTVSNVSGTNQHTKFLVGGGNRHQPKTRKLIADAHNISQTAVKEAVEFGRGLEAANEIVPGFREKVLIGEAYKAQKKSHGGIRGNQHTVLASDQNGHLPKQEKTRNSIAKQFGIGSTSVQRAEEFVDGLNAADEIAPGFRGKQRSTLASLQNDDLPNSARTA